MEFIIALSKIAGGGGGKCAFADVDTFGKLLFVYWKVNSVLLSSC